MNITGAEVVAFAAAAVTAFIAAVRNDWFPKVEKVALAVCFAAVGFFLMVASHFNIGK
jgi:hypothetical protein